MRNLSTALCLVALGVAAGCSSSDGGGTPDASVCTAGALGCACNAAGACDGTLACKGGVCGEGGTTGRGFAFADPSARACEMLFDVTPDGAALSMVWGAATHGALRRADPHVAVAVARDSNTPFAADSVGLTAAAGTQLTLRSARCFDAAGAPLAASGVTLR